MGSLLYVTWVLEQRVSFDQTYCKQTTTSASSTFDILVLSSFVVSRDFQSSEVLVLLKSLGTPVGHFRANVVMVPGVKADVTFTRLQLQGELV